MYCVKPIVRLDDISAINKIRKLGGKTLYFKTFISYKHFEEKSYIKEYCKKNYITLFPCGQCLPCINMSRYRWVKKCEIEKLNWNYCYFITLTYDPEHLPIDRSLNVKHVQNFIRYLRSEFGKNYPLRYLIAGEYGSKYDRPHYHCIIFTNYELDLKFWYMAEEGPLFMCDLIDKCWLHKGLCVIAHDNNSSSFGYVVSYSNKYKLKQVWNTFDKTKKRIENNVMNDYSIPANEKQIVIDFALEQLGTDWKPEFMIMSKKPPIGSITPPYLLDWNNYPSKLLKWLDKYYSDGINKTDYYLEIEKRQKHWYEFITTHDLQNIVAYNNSKLEDMIRKFDNKKTKLD